MTVKDMKAEASVEAPPGKNGFSLISSEKLIQLYGTMLKCRMLEERVQSLLKQGRLRCGYSAAAGQEAAAAGIVLDLLREDSVGPPDSGLMACFVRGLSWERLFRKLLAPGEGPETELPASDRSGFASLNVLDPASTLSSQLNLSIKVAQTNKLERNGLIAVVFCDEEPASQDSWHEALKIAGRQELPMIFVLNRDESHSQESRVKPGGNSTRAPENGIPSIPVDGSDVVAVYRVASEAMGRARKGFGSTVIECVASGLSGRAAVRSGKDSPRKDAEWWRVGDPIAKMEEYLTRKGLFRAALRTEVCIEFNQELDAAIALAEKVDSRGA